MDDEQRILTQQATEDGNGVSIADILCIFRAHIILILVITLLFAAGGFLYSKIRKPVYTATVPVQFDVEINSIIVDEHGNETNKVNQTSSTTYLFAYIDTAVGICKSGEVIDRANVYYDIYLRSGKDIDVFMKEIDAAYRTVKDSHDEIPDYAVTDEAIERTRNVWFDSSNVGTNYSSSGSSSDVKVNFGLQVSDLNAKNAKEMARVYAFAADVSLNKILVFDSGTAGLVDLAGSTSGVSVSPDMSTRRILIIAAILGFAVAVATVYIMSIADNTVKSKELLEEITGSGVIAYIDDIAEAR